MSKETLEITTSGSIGILGITLPNLEATSQFFMGMTPILSFFLVLVPTGIWAWFRAIKYVKDYYSKED